MNHTLNSIIMNSNTPNQVISLPFTVKEKQHTSRNRIAYHVFLSMFFYDFQKLSMEEKMNVCELDILGDDDISIDTTDTPPAIASDNVIRAAAKKWHEIDIEIKEAWKQRVIELNRQTQIDGTFEVV